jgi:hypothetical protein
MPSTIGIRDAPENAQGFQYVVYGPDLRNERKMLEAGYNGEIKALEPRLAINPRRCKPFWMTSPRTRAKKITPAD